MSFEVKVIEDSISPAGKRITSLQLRYPRFIHAEFMTHRVFSRNASSSRAIPVEKMIDSIIQDTAMPIHWGKNRPGMQANEELSEEGKTEAKDIWLQARDRAIVEAQNMIRLGGHKQIVNRLLEPFMHINVLVTATEWDNFFELRCHRDAQPEIRVLAEMMRDAMSGSTPQSLFYYQWHLPYVLPEERLSLPVQDCLMISTARSARVSYLTHDARKPDPGEDMRLFHRLVGAVPLHASPCEHQATPASEADTRSRNFIGWIQYRDLFESTRPAIDGS